MDAFPLQNELVDAVIGYANAKLEHPDEVRHYFKGTWEPDEIPRLKACRRIQSEVRLQLLTAADFDNRESHDAMRGLRWNLDQRNFTRLDAGIRLEGWLGVKKVPVIGGHDERVVWNWRVKNASLRAICGLAVSTIIQEGLHWNIGLCALDGCLNIFLDRKSRGIRRKYCGSEECEKVRNQQAVEKSRKANKRKRGEQ